MWWIGLCLLVIIGKSEDQLIYVAILNTHGARYPVNNLYDGKQNELFSGQLTSVGMRQQYLLGTYLKHDYIDEKRLINPQLNPNQLEVYSTSISRSALSVTNLLYGLYPTLLGPQIPSQVTEDKLIPPFQEHTNLQMSLIDDFALNQGFQPVPFQNIDSIMKNCEHYGVLQTNRYKEIISQITQLSLNQSIEIAKLKLMFNLSTLQISIPTLAELYDTLQSDLYLGRQLPKGFNDFDMTNLKFISDYYNTLLNSDYFAQIISTPLLQLLSSKFFSAINVKNAKKMSIYECQMSNMIGLLTVLNLTSAECLYQKWKNETISNLNCMSVPRYSSNLIFELYRDQTYQYYIRIKYNGEYVYLCGEQKLQCGYNEFHSRLQDKYQDFDKLCGKQ